MKQELQIKDKVLQEIKSQTGSQELTQGNLLETITRMIEERELIELDRQLLKDSLSEMERQVDFLKDCLESHREANRKSIEIITTLTEALSKQRNGIAEKLTLFPIGVS